MLNYFLHGCDPRLRVPGGYCIFIVVFLFIL